MSQMDDSYGAGSCDQKAYYAFTTTERYRKSKSALQAKGVSLNAPYFAK